MTRLDPSFFSFFLRFIYLYYAFIRSSSTVGHPYTKLGAFRISHLVHGPSRLGAVMLVQVDNISKNLGIILCCTGIVLRLLLGAGDV
jgi:hypothetical protein